ncbi:MULTISPECIES: MarR family winged helix-turn-helix transcriptional regulator [Paracoccus]|jgi:DNA-binding MarR family transcriptional regulator|uniref:MarR family winged helix-turn-helix transcriptional regulator n=1 Tax=Paracoccus TaxID=265 RepID=UPI0025869D25|nr:MarR family winged helix-turn-helix transcriptional regulator [Paracoccus sp. (in: a-proteobacteria)]
MTMNTERSPGLGELLRYVGELVDAGASRRYRDLGLSYRPRYTPILRAILAGKTTVTEIVGHSRLTQGAVSQTVALMVADGILAREGTGDGRKSSLRLTERGQALLAALRPHWQATFAAIEALETEIGHPLRQILAKAADALERKGFAARLERAAIEQESPADHAD